MFIIFLSTLGWVIGIVLFFVLVYKTKYDNEKLDKFRENSQAECVQTTVKEKVEETSTTSKENQVKSIILSPTLNTNIFELSKYETAISYNSLLKSPKWLDKRNIILERDCHKCCYCGNTYKLQVHHKYYSKYPNEEKVDPWNYPNNALITLCGSCHRKVHQRKTIKVYYRKYDN